MRIQHDKTQPGTIGPLEPLREAVQHVRGCALRCATRSPAPAVQHAASWRTNCMLVITVDDCVKLVEQHSLMEVARSW